MITVISEIKNPSNLQKAYIEKYKLFYKAMLMINVSDMNYYNSILNELSRLFNTTNKLLIDIDLKTKVMTVKLKQPTI